MLSAILASTDLLALVLRELTATDAAALSLTCTLAAAGCSRQQQQARRDAHAPRVVVCASGSQQFLVLPLTPAGQPYREPISCRRTTRQRGHARRCQLELVADARTSKRGPRQWLTSLAFSPYDGHMYVCAYGLQSTAAPVAPGESQPAGGSILRYSPGKLRPKGVLVSDQAVGDPEGLAFAKHTCYVASSAHAAIVAIALHTTGSGPHTGSIAQSLSLADDAVPWGVAAWDPATYPMHAQAAAAQQQTTTAAPALAAPADPVGASAFAAAAAAGCLLVAVQADEHKKQWWVPPKGPASGSLVCVPLGSDGRMSRGWREWSRVKVKRPSGVTIDQAGHVWCTSLERLLLRFAGPCHQANSGCLLQRVDLAAQQLLPSFAAALYPIDVHAVRGCGGGTEEDSHGSQQLLVVTLHAGPAGAGVVAVLARSDGGQGLVGVVNCWQEPSMQQPNMIAIQQ